MAERPLLLFPTPEAVDRSKKGGGFPKIHTPGKGRQGERLSPIFDQLQAAFEARRVEILQSAAGVDPDQVLVIETIGGVDKFVNAVKKIEGLEWMGEFDSDPISPDNEFYDESNPSKDLSGRLYMVMSNQRALSEMLSLWRRFIDDPLRKFERGFTKFRDVFLCLKNIRRWGVQDRLLETEVLDAWQENLPFAGDNAITFEAELWFRGSRELREAGARHVTHLVEQEGGRVLGQSVIEGIAYHGILAELPASAIQTIVESPTTELVKCENVMFFRPTGQMVVGKTSDEGELGTAQIETGPLPSGYPVVALLDGLPMANHRLLEGRLMVDDPDDWAADYQASERIHGSCMASLIVHGDLNRQQPPLSRPVYVRPIMKPKRHLDHREEGVPDKCLVVDLVHRSVIRLFEGEAESGPVASTVKVINLSIGDPNRQFTQVMSPLARLLDWLSVKYSVLFIVSAGNHHRFSLEISRADFESFRPDEREAAIIHALHKVSRHRKLLSPAETMNGLSVGALHEDEAPIGHLGSRFNPYTSLLPSPASAFGGGFRRAVKPDLLFSGGRQLYREPFLSPVMMEPATFRSSPGNKAAAPGPLPGALDQTAYSCGTSNATALISRAAGMCYETIQQILDEQAPHLETLEYEVPLLKAMLIHGCSWGQIGARISEVLRIPSPKDRSVISQWIGYGVPELDRVMACTDQRATILGFGRLTAGEGQVFKLPLPPSLGSRPEWRRLTVTLAWLSPISANTQKYRNAALWFEINKILTLKRTESKSQDVQRGTVQHEIFEGRRADPFIDGQDLEIKVNCREDAGKIAGAVAYGLAVTLEVAEGLDIAIYEEVRTRIEPRIPIQAMGE